MRGAGWGACLWGVIVAGWATTANAGPIEPGLQDRDDIVLWSDFEDDDWLDAWTVGTFPINHTPTPDAAFGGRRSLRVSVPAGAHYGGSLEYTFAAAGLPEPEELYFRYYVNIPAVWELDDDGEIGKLPGFGGTYNVAGWGGNPSDGTNGWSARMMNWDLGEQARVGFYVYHADMQGTYGDHEPWMPDLPRDTWICVEAHVAMNTITDGVGNTDGVLQGWIDDELAFSSEAMRFRHVDTLAIEKVWANVYVGGSWTADHDMHLYFDNMVVAYDRIGCFDDSAVGGTGTGGSTSGGDDTGGDTTSAGDGVSAEGTGVPPGDDGATSGRATSTGAPATSGTAPADGEDSGGCGCVTTATPSGSALWLVVLLGSCPRRRSPNARPQ